MAEQRQIIVVSERSGAPKIARTKSGGDQDIPTEIQDILRKLRVTQHLLPIISCIYFLANYLLSGGACAGWFHCYSYGVFRNII